MDCPGIISWWEGVGKEWILFVAKCCQSLIFIFSFCFNLCFSDLFSIAQPKCLHGHGQLRSTHIFYILLFFFRGVGIIPRGGGL